MMDCNDWKAFAHDYVFGDLADPARERLDRHAESCSSCLREAGALKSVDRRLRADPVLEPPSGLARRALEEAPARARRDLWRVAAALLVAGSIGALTTLGLPLPDDWNRVPGVMSKAAQMIPDFWPEKE